MQHRPHARLAAVAVAGALTLAACGDNGETAESPESEIPEPTVVASAEPPIPPPDPGPEIPPPPGMDGPVWKAPFDDVPFRAGSMLVGLVFPTDQQSDLQIVGVDPQGTTQWAVQTNPSCVGFGVTRVEDQWAAVVLASDADNRDGKIATKTTANAYDVSDGSRVWGPTSVPGPMQGPGLIFGQTNPSVVGDEPEAKLMLAAGTGEPVDPPRDGAVPLYEHHGVGLFGSDDEVMAVDTRTGSVLWESDQLDLPPEWPIEAPVVELLAATGASEAGVIALSWSDSTTGEDGVQQTSLHELSSGRLITDLGTEQEPRTVVDTDTGTVIVGGLAGYRETRAFDRESGDLRWKDDGSGGMMDITLAGHGIGYGTRAGQSVAVDLHTGRILEEGGWPVPVAASTADLRVSPLPLDPDAGTTDRVEGAGPGYVAYQRK